MTYVLNVFVRTKFNSGVTHNSVDIGGKDIIFKFSYPTYRGLELFSGAFTQIEGIHHIIGNDGGKMKGSIWYAKDYTDIKYDPTKSYSYSDTHDLISTPDKDIPYIKGFRYAGEYDASSGWVKNANYDVSLFCVTECGGKANDKSYECGYVWRGGNNIDNGFKYVNASVVGCSANNNNPGRTLNTINSVAGGNAEYAGGFSIPNISISYKLGVISPWS